MTYVASFYPAFIHDNTALECDYIIAVTTIMS